MAAQIYVHYFLLCTLSKINWAEAALFHVKRQMVIMPICASSSILL